MSACDTGNCSIFWEVRQVCNWLFDRELYKQNLHGNAHQKLVPDQFNFGKYIE